MMRPALFVLALLASAAASAGALQDFRAFSASTQSASARFEQRAYDRRGAVVDTSSGEFSFSRPGKFRWSYLKPYRQLIVGDGARVWLYDEDLKQATVRNVGRALSATPAALLAGKEDITALFTLRDGGSADGLNWVEASPKAQDTGFERVRLGLRGRSLAAMELFDSLGGHTVLRFADLKSNAPVSADQFRFTPPKGADVLQDK
jgi:outer membrane lipoprotein carrier protein